MDTIVVILLVILILAVVIFAFTSRSSDNISGNAVAQRSFPSQYGGGGCGR